MSIKMTHEVALTLLRTEQLSEKRYFELCRDNGWPQNRLPSRDDQIGTLLAKRVECIRQQRFEEELLIMASLRALGALQPYKPYKPRVPDEDSADFQEEAEAAGVSVRDLL